GVRRPPRQAALQGRVVQGLQLLPRRVLRDREDGCADRALLPLGLAEGRGEPPGPLPDGPGRLGEELAGRAPPAWPRGGGVLLRDRELSDVRGAAAPHSSPPP